jgi:hypothetical protein
LQHRVGHGLQGRVAGHGLQLGAARQLQAQR